MPKPFRVSVQMSTPSGVSLGTFDSGEYSCREAWVNNIRSNIQGTIARKINAGDRMLATRINALVGEDNYPYALFWLTRYCVKLSIKTGVTGAMADETAVEMSNQLAERFPNVRYSLQIDNSATIANIFAATNNPYQRALVFESDTHFAAMNPAWWWIYINRKYFARLDEENLKPLTDLTQLIQWSTSRGDVYYSGSDHQRHVEYWDQVKLGKYAQPSDWMYGSNGPIAIRGNTGMKTSRKRTRQRFIKLFKESGQSYRKEVESIFA